MRKPKGKAAASSSSSSSSSAPPAAVAVESQSEVIARLRKSANASVTATNAAQTAKFNKETGRSRWHGKDQATAKWRKEVLQYQLEQGITGDFMIPEMLCSFTVDVVAKRDKRGKKNVGHKLKPNCVITYYNRMKFAFKMQAATSAGKEHAKLHNYSTSADQACFTETVNTLGISSANSGRVEMIESALDAVASISEIKNILAEFDRRGSYFGHLMRTNLNLALRIGSRNVASRGLRIFEIGVDPTFLDNTPMVYVILSWAKGTRASSRAKKSKNVGLIRHVDIDQCAVGDLAVFMLYQALHRPFDLDNVELTRQRPFFLRNPEVVDDMSKVTYEQMNIALTLAMEKTGHVYGAKMHITKYTCIQTMQAAGVAQTNRNAHVGMSESTGGGKGRSKNTTSQFYETSIIPNAIRALAGHPKDATRDMIKVATPRALLTLPPPLLTKAMETFAPTVGAWERAHASDSRETKKALSEVYRLVGVLKFMVKVMVQDAPFRRRRGLSPSFYASPFFISPPYISFERSIEVGAAFTQMQVPPQVAHMTPEMKRYMGPGIAAMATAVQAQGEAQEKAATAAATRDVRLEHKLDTLARAVFSGAAAGGGGGAAAAGAAAAAFAGVSAPPPPLRLASLPLTHSPLPRLTHLAGFGALVKAMMEGFGVLPALSTYQMRCGVNKVTAGEMAKLGKLKALHFVVTAKAAVMALKPGESEVDKQKRAATELDAMWSTKPSNLLHAYNRVFSTQARRATTKDSDAASFKAFFKPLGRTSRQRSRKRQHAQIAASSSSSSSSTSTSSTSASLSSRQKK